MFIASLPELAENLRATIVVNIAPCKKNQQNIKYGLEWQQTSNKLQVVSQHTE